MRGTLTVSLCTWLVLLLNGCSDSSGPEADYSLIHGTVLDADGAPAAGAAILMNYRTDPPWPWQGSKPETQIGFGLPESAHVKLWIASYCDEDTVKVLVDGTLPAGRHAIHWDATNTEGRRVCEGVYWYHLRTPENSRDRDMVLIYLNYDDVASATEVEPLAVTDVNGHFQLSQECLPFDYQSEILDEQGQAGTLTILRTVRFWAIHDGLAAAAYSDWVSVDPTSGVEVSISLPF